MRLIFVRHGEPDYANDCLTPNGRIQAQCTAKRLAGENLAAIYASPMGRAVETATYTAQGHGLTVNKLDFMHEIGWGDKKVETDSRSESAGDSLVESGKLPYDGHPWTLAYKLITEDPQYTTSPLWKDHHFFNDNLLMDYYEPISSGIDELLSQYGITRKDSTNAMIGTYFCKQKNDSTIALFAHGGSGAIMFSYILNLPLPYVLTTMPYGVCSVTIIDFAGETGEPIIPRIELFNDMEHLESVKKEMLHFEM